MPLDKPTFPNEQEVNLQAATLTYGACTNPGNAIDDDPATYAVFGNPQYIQVPPPTVVFDDTFHRANGSVGNGWTSTSGTWVIENNRLKCTIATDSDRLLRPIGESGLNQEVLTHIPPNGISGTGNVSTVIYCRYQAGGSAWYVITADHGSLHVEKQVGGVATDLFVTDYAYDKTHEIICHITAQGSFPTTIKATLTDVTTGIVTDCGTITDSSPSLQVAGQAGIGAASIPVGCQVLFQEVIVYFAPPTHTIIEPRFLRVDWGEDLLISRVRFSQFGTGAVNTGISFESSLGYLQGHDPPPELHFGTYVPLPIDDTIHELILNPPFLGRGIVVYPDYLLDTSGLTPGQYPAVNLAQVQVYEQITGANTMPQTGIPTIKPFRVGCSGLTIYSPWAASQSSLALNASNATGFSGIEGLDVDFKSTSAKIKGGESVRPLEGFETDLEIMCGFKVKGHDYRAFLALMGGTLVVNAANVNGAETQYFRRTSKADRAGYFTLVANSTNGTPNENFIVAKAKYLGITRNQSRDKETDFDVKFEIFPDDTWINQDGSIGGDYEFIFTNSAGTPALHS